MGTVVTTIGLLAVAAFLIWRGPSVSSSADERTHLGLVVAVSLILCLCFVVAALIVA
jgi:hypothetical protein